MFGAVQTWASDSRFKMSLLLRRSQHTVKRETFSLPAGTNCHLIIRPILPSDAEDCGRIAYEAHRTIADKHGYPPEQPSVEFSTGLVNMKLNDPNTWGVLAERESQILGSIFLNTFPPAPVAVIGPLTVKPSAEGGVGHELMVSALEEARGRGFDQVRLVQSPSHFRSLALYTKLGFDVREPLILVQGKPTRATDQMGDRLVRPANRDDIAICNRLCLSIHGLEREFELSQAVQQGSAMVVEYENSVTAYATGIGLRGHAVAKTTDDLKALISFAPSFLGPGFFVPIRNGELLRWLLAIGMRLAWPANLMTLGEYKEPSGAFLPSIAF
jgi:predicted N-acetyltransferase YhbS